MSSSRALISNSRGSRTSTKNYPEHNPPLSSRNMNEGVLFPEAYSSSREIQSGMFYNKLKRDAKKKEELPLEIEIVQRSNPMIKNRSSYKPFASNRESRDQYYQSQHQVHQMDDNDYWQTAIHEKIDEKIEYMSNQLFANLNDKFTLLMNDQAAKTDENLQDIVNQINKVMKKKDEMYLVLKSDTMTLKDQVGKLAKDMESFSRQNEEKMQSLVCEIAQMSGGKKSKAHGDYGMDLKNSFQGMNSIQGMNSSLSVNLGNESISQNSKLVNQVIFQLDSLKKEINENKIQIDELSLKLSSKLPDARNDACMKSESAQTGLSLKEDEIIKLMKDTLNREKKNWKIQEKFDAFQAKMKEFERIAFTQEQNLKGMNDELANSINLQINPKIKKIEAGLIDLYARSDPIEMERLIKSHLETEINERMKDTKTLRIRGCTKNESNKLSVITGGNQDKVSFKQTYMLDEQNFLLDSEGVYLVEEMQGQRKRIRIEENQLYLLQAKGIQISGCT